MKTRKLFLLGALIVTMATFVIPATLSYADCGSGWYMDNNGNCYQPNYYGPQTYNYNNNYNWNNQNAYNYNNQYQRSLLQSYVDQLNTLLNRLQNQQYGNVYNGYSNQNYNYYYGRVTATTNSPQQIGTTQATMRGTVTFQNTAQATIYFQYGTSQNNLNTDTTHLVVNGTSQSTNFQAVVVQLNPNTTYYYRAVAIDQYGSAQYGTIYNFTTYNNYNYNYSYNNNYPYYNYNNYSYNCYNPYGCNYNNASYVNVLTDGYSNVSNTSARINGSVSMNNNGSGYAFFVYGTNASAVSNVANTFNTYDQVMNNGNALRKAGVGSVSGTSGNYYYNLYALPNSSQIYYALCVEASNGNQPQLTCGSTQSFYTNY